MTKATVTEIAHVLSEHMRPLGVELSKSELGELARTIRDRRTPVTTSTAYRQVTRLDKKAVSYQKLSANLKSTWTGISDAMRKTAEDRRLAGRL